MKRRKKLLLTTPFPEERREVTALEVVRALCLLSGERWTRFETIYCEALGRTQIGLLPFDSEGYHFTKCIASRREDLMEILELGGTEQGPPMPPLLHRWLGSLAIQARDIAEGLNSG